MKFNKLDIIEPLLRAVKEQGYEDATPIQEKAIPQALQGKDILGCAQTGTGKTAAFSIPTIQQLYQAGKRDYIRALILTPTRELAIQIQENMCAYAKYTEIKSAVIFGGVSQKPQERAIQNGVDIVIATPGRLNDLIKQSIIDLSHIEIFILDEADRMLDMGFLNDVKKIIAQIPVKKQTLFFSATMPKEIRTLVHTLLVDPVSVEVTPVSSTAKQIDQTLYYVDKANKKHLLLDILEHNDVQNALIFTRTKHNANRLGKFLINHNIKAGVIHGNKSQNARQIALTQFKEGKIRILVATDIAARGIDVSELSHVFNYDMPNEAEAYVHRIGRTGRAGKTGTSISFSDIDEIDYVKSIQKLIDCDIPVNREHAYPMLVTTPTPKKKQGQGRNTSPKQGKQSNKSKNSKSSDTGVTKKSYNNNKQTPSKSKQFGKDTKANDSKKRDSSSHAYQDKKRNSASSSIYAMRGK
ncbi:DEAD/DEAH box helicase [Clostridiaceae bacterium DONG20-135]|uniref:ATP-dependent RNA helicase CshA n=1 Tax=Copranaerobaculum intestinale TaxID=2692629 RepID=A0A6N8U4C7_9FIRM|nr:DEAD/DEAH box helicase [Copranaerobaculum intestinale]MXQ72952.1 DEAD/DEAH box helicase [Copranaerobaculum intestinale]